MEFSMGDDMYEQVRAYLSEFAHNWVFVVEDADGSYLYDFSTPIAGKALLHQAVIDLQQEEQISRVEYFMDFPEEGKGE